MTEKHDEPERLGDKDLLFKTCEECGSRAELFVFDNRPLCSDCAIGLD